MKKVQVKDPTTNSFHEVKLELWDTAGQERWYIIKVFFCQPKKRYRSMAPMYYRNAAIAFLVYAVDNYVNKKNFLKRVNIKGIVSKSNRLDGGYEESASRMLTCTYRYKKRFEKQVG